VKNLVSRSVAYLNVDIAVQGIFHQRVLEILIKVADQMENII
jgi:hypothetical protein